MLLGAARPDIAALRQSVTDLSASATEHNTQLAHRRARRYWIVFASAYPDLAADPCDVAHLQLFISFLVHNNKTHSNIVQILGGVGASTCDSRWAATRSHPAITNLLAGIHRTQQEHNHLSRGPPRRSDIITPDTLLTILDRVDPMAPDALLFTTVALAAFDRLFRLCELLEPNPRRDGATPHNRGRKFCFPPSHIAPTATHPSTCLRPKTTPLGAAPSSPSFVELLPQLCALHPPYTTLAQFGPCLNTARRRTFSR